MTTEDLKHAIAFAKIDTHKGDLRVILTQAKHACRTLAAEIAKLPIAANGVPIVPSERYWVRVKGGARVVLILGISFSFDGWLCTAHNGDGYTPGELWSTREAAEEEG